MAAINNGRSFETFHRAVLAPDGRLTASVVNNEIVIRTTSAKPFGKPQSLIKLDPAFAARATILSWSHNRADTDDKVKNEVEEEKRRVLLATGDKICVFDVARETKIAEIETPADVTGEVSHVEFGRTEEEVVVCSKFNVKFTIGNISSGRGYDFENQKFGDSRGYGYRARTGHFALLTRSGGSDIVSFHESRTYSITKAMAIPTTDAKGLKWSPNGNWLAVWDAAHLPVKVLVYTADGQLYKQILADDPSRLGVKFVEWDDQSVHFVVCEVGERNLVVRNNFTFAPVMEFKHQAPISKFDLPVWMEKVSATGERSYSRAKMPVYPRSAFNSSNRDVVKPSSISIASFNHEGSLIATVHELYPTTVWIWSIKDVKATAVLLQHEPISQLLWHPATPNLLMIIAVSNMPYVYQWENEEHPRCALLPLKTAGGGKMVAKWIPRRENGLETFFCGNKTNFVVGALEGGASSGRPAVFKSISEMERQVLQDTKGRVLPQLTLTKTEKADVTELFDENGELTPDGVKNTRDIELSSFEDNFDDTFHFQRQGKAKKLDEEPVPLLSDLGEKEW